MVSQTSLGLMCGMVSRSGWLSISWTCRRTCSVNAMSDG